MRLVIIQVAPRKRAHELFKPIKPSSVKTEGERSDAWEEYRIKQETMRERMARQREARLSATPVLKQRTAHKKARQMRGHIWRAELCVWGETLLRGSRGGDAAMRTTYKLKAAPGTG